ncbi:MAG: hypothetical protein QM572_03555 [Nocardioides sp.]|uniref:hypothetical protein n=1 Tax=Nocardioides sp. TaxID=35761 RepID=UPI0039E4B2D9
MALWRGRSLWARIGLVALAVVLALVLLKVLSDITTRHSAKGKAREAGTQALQRRGEALERLEEKVRQLAGALGPEAGRWTYLSCEITSIDAGWVPIDYEQVCTMQAVAVFDAATATSAEIAARVGRGAAVSGEEEQCGTSIYVPVQSGSPGAGGHLAWYGAGCQDPRTSISLHDDYSWEAVGFREDADPVTLPEGGSWVAVTAGSEEVRSETLGCVGIPIYGCNGALEDPLLPERS